MFAIVGNLLVPECTKPSRSQSLANFSQTSICPEFLQQVESFTISFAISFAVASEILRNGGENSLAILGVPKPGCSNFTQKRSFALFCALLRSCALCCRLAFGFCAHLRSFACFCVRLRLERPRLWTSESLCDHNRDHNFDCTTLCTKAGTAKPAGEAWADRLGCESRSHLQVYTWEAPLLEEAPKPP